jgi:hypothetical protein
MIGLMSHKNLRSTVPRNAGLIHVCVLCKYYNKNVKERLFVVGDLVLKWKMSQDGMHKLSSPWEGPFEVIEVTQPTSYRLAYLDGTELPNSWHIDKLRHFYP